MPFISEPFSLVFGFFAVSILEVMFNEGGRKCQCFWICRRCPFQRILVFNISGNIRFTLRSELILVRHGWLSYYTGRRRRVINLGWPISQRKMLIECFCVLNESLRDGGEEIT